MLRKFWQIRYHNILLAIRVLGILIPTFLSAQGSSYPEIFQTLDKLITIDEHEYKELSRKIQINPITRDQLKDLRNVTLDPLFLKSILLHSNSAFLNMAAQKECLFYSFLENKLLTRPGLAINNIPIRYTQDEKRLSGIITFKDFFDFIYGQRCKKNNDISKIFKKNYLDKTLKTLKFPIPDNKNSCIKILRDWHNNESIGPICRIAQTIELAPLLKRRLSALPPSSINLRRQLHSRILKASWLQKKFSPFKSDYLIHLCNNLGADALSQKNFCQRFLSTSFWKKVAANRIDRIELKIKCQHLLKKKNLPPHELNRCSNLIAQDKRICHYLETEKYQALIPMPNCNDISEALNISRLKAKYQDCPGRVDNEAIITMARILSHLNDRSYDLDEKQCNNISVSQFVDFNFNNKNEEAWKMHLCYHDPIENKELCLPVIIGQSATSRYSETQAVAHILRRTKRASKSLKCILVKKSRYNPNRIKYKHKCFLIYDKNYCTSLSCPKRIVFQNRDIKNITYRGAVTFDYFPNSLREDQKSLVYVLEKVRNARRRAIRNITDLKYYLGSSSNAIVHGQGCIEDIYPRNFNKRYMNQCTPISFIIDGIIEKKFKFYVTLRTGADSVHSPRIVSWYNIYNALTNYQILQPINHWTLYGIR